MPMPRKYQRDFVCEQCGDSFVGSVRPKRKTPHPRFCGRECQRLGMPVHRVEIVCSMCDRPYTPKYRLSKKRVLRFCSKSCAGMSKWMATDPAPTREALVELVRKIIRAAKRYVSAAEIHRQTGKGVKHFIGLNIPQINYEEGYDPPADASHLSAFEKRVGAALREIFLHDEVRSPKSFTDLVGVRGGRLKYDFFIESKKLLVEADGAQHNPDSPWSSEVQIANDRRKDEYAKKNGYTLVRVPYRMSIGKNEVETALNAALRRDRKTLGQIVANRRGLELDALVPQIRKLVEQGLTNPEIATAVGHGLNRQHVARLLHRHRIKRNPSLRRLVMKKTNPGHSPPSRPPTLDDLDDPLDDPPSHGLPLPPRVDS